MRHIVTHYWNEMDIHNEFFRLTSEFNRRVAQRLGWRFDADSKKRVSIENPWREKAAKLVESFEGMPDGDQVLWIDGDCLLVGNDIELIFDDLGIHDIGMVKFGASKEWNCGVTPMTVNPVVRALWKDVRDHPNNMLLDLEEHVKALDNDHFIPVGEHRVTVVELARKWNETYDERNSFTEIIGFHGYDAYTKRDRIASVLEILKCRI